MPGIRCPVLTEQPHLKCQTAYISKKKNPLHSGLPEEAQNSSQLLPLLPSFLSTPPPSPFFCQPPLLCSSQRVKEGKVMSGPPGLHCVLALCHCIACRPQTHVQETFLYSQLATRQRYLHLLQMYANAAIGRGSNSSTDTYTPLTFYRRLHRKGLPQKRWPGFACPCHLQCHLHHRAFANGFSPNRERLGGQRFGVSP